MRKADATYKALFLLTLFFSLVAGLSFAAFQGTKTLCEGGAEKCERPAPANKAGGQMLWDDFSRRFVSSVSF